MNPYAATIEQFTHWLRAYQTAWEGRDAAAAWEAAVSSQRDVRLTFDVFAVSGPTGFATWRVFREWWHSAESPG